jgi:hypothetical protein
MTFGARKDMLVGYCFVVMIEITEESVVVLEVTPPYFSGLP